MAKSSLRSKESRESLFSIGSIETTDTQPDELPPPIKSQLTWQANDLSETDFIIYLEPTEVDAVRAAIISFKLTGQPRNCIDRSTFPLPAPLARKLALVSEQIHSGRGIAVIRGLEGANLNDEESVIAFAGVASYVCSQRATDRFANQTLSHVRDATRQRPLEGTEGIGLAGSKLPVAMEFHADRFSGDVLALYVRNTGEIGNGGDQYFASFEAVYNELLAVAPDVLQVLAAENWPFELKHPKSAEPYLEPGPVLFFSKGKVMCQLVRAPLLGSPRIPRSDTMPALSPEQLHALKLVEDTARRFCIKLDRRKGDLQFINNLAIMHARSAYGSATGSSSRHLLRMFLRDPERAWEKPAAYAGRFDDPFETNRPQNLPVLDTDPWRKISGHESHG